MKPSNLFGSDVYENYTAAYTWNSNQMAHAMMGFAGTTLLAHGFIAMGCSPWWAFLFVIIPALKDYTDFRADRTRAGPIFPTKPSHIRELVVDGLTDNLFWNAGMVFAILLAVDGFSSGRATGVVFLVAIIVAAAGILVPGKHFNHLKLLFDRSALPYFFRLPNFTGNPVSASEVTAADIVPIGERDAAVKTVEDYTYAAVGAAQHLVLMGPPRCRKTTLAAAIGSGLTVKKKTVRYLSQSTLSDELTKASEERSDQEPFSLKDVEIVIVDDVVDDIGSDLPAQLVAKRTVWVLAATDPSDEVVQRIASGLTGRTVAVALGQPVPEEAGNIQEIPRPVTILSTVSLAIPAVLGLGSLALVLIS
jgi:hypothetical protein